MERDREIIKLVNVLRRIVRAAGYAAWNNAKPDAARFCALQYNKVLARMEELAEQYPRYGYRRVRVFLGRDGHRMSAGRAYRLWRTAKLPVARKQPRKRPAVSRPRPLTPTSANQV